MLDGPNLKTPTIKEVKPGTGIYKVRHALSDKVCATLVKMFERYDGDHQEGMMLGGVNRDVKRGTEILIRTQPHFQSADRVLFHSLNDAMRQYCDVRPQFIREHDIKDSGYQLQRTNAGEFYKLHCDGGGQNQNRILVAIWYLNTLKEDQGGCTEFPEHGIKIRPEAGKLVLFPPYHTHYHQGNEVEYGGKYIATTWLVDD